jgi:hypothetical protein
VSGLKCNRLAEEYVSKNGTRIIGHSDCGLMHVKPFRIGDFVQEGRRHGGNGRSFDFLHAHPDKQERGGDGSEPFLSKEPPKEKSRASQIS